MTCQIDMRASLVVAVSPGFPAAIDAFAEHANSRHSFLRAAWFGPAAPGARTLTVERADGSPLLAIPTAPFGLPVLGVRTVPGSYWPFRSPLVASDAAPEELAQALSHPTTRDALSPLWRVGPVHADDPGTRALRAAALGAGWRVLAVPVGRTFVLGLDGGPARNRRLDAYARRLAERGPVRFEIVSGPDWSDATLDALATVERASWVGTSTDGRGAKFLSDDQRAYWRHVLRDPVLARCLAATVLRVGERPVAFSFDLIDGATQYAVACGYDPAFAEFRPGHLVTRRQLAHAAEAGVRRVDLGAGDSGYKRTMGAEPGSEIVDLLFVRSRPAAALLSLRWGGASGTAASLRRWREPLVATGALAAAGALLLAE